MSESEAFFLFDEINLDVVVPDDVIFDLVAEVTDNDRRLINPIFDDFIHDMADDRLAGHIQKNLRDRICMRPETTANACDRYDCSQVSRMPRTGRKVIIKDNK